MFKRWLILKYTMDFVQKEFRKMLTIFFAIIPIKVRAVKYTDKVTQPPSIGMWL